MTHPLRFPKLHNLRADPFENADVSGDMAYVRWPCRSPLHVGASRRTGRTVHKDDGRVPASTESEKLEPRGDAGETPQAELLESGNASGVK
jgi:hypothetical protein